TSTGVSGDPSSDRAARKSSCAWATSALKECWMRGESILNLAHEPVKTIDRPAAAAGRTAHAPRVSIEVNITMDPAVAPRGTCTISRAYKAYALLVRGS